LAISGTRRRQRVEALEVERHARAPRHRDHVGMALVEPPKAMAAVTALSTLPW
jgi:hypothetical protein